MVEQSFSKVGHLIPSHYSIKLMNTVVTFNKHADLGSSIGLNLKKTNFTEKVI